MRIIRGRKGSTHTHIRVHDFPVDVDRHVNLALVIYSEKLTSPLYISSFSFPPLLGSGHSFYPLYLFGQSVRPLCCILVIYNWIIDRLVESRERKESSPLPHHSAPSKLGTHQIIETTRSSNVTVTIFGSFKTVYIIITMMMIPFVIPGTN